jgi:predicted dehydrogenase
MHTLAVLNPGHFHAALTLRERHSRLSDEIYVYSQGGPELKSFLDIVEAYNTRPDNPTGWRVQIYEGDDCLERMIQEKKGDIAILAGKNNTKMAHIAALAEAGFSVLADKPWVTDYEALKHLKSALAPGLPPVVDMMTERYEITTIMQKMLLEQEDIFGRLTIPEDGSPAVYKFSVHHLYKLVNGKPLVRPPWYFDVNVQGEGIIDVSTHLVYITHWMLHPGQVIDYDKDLELLQARRWPTKIPLDIFEQITGQGRFPDSVAEYVNGDVLDYFCNGEMLYNLRGVPVHIKLIWNLIEPEGAKDLHESMIRGTRSDLRIRQLPEKGFMTELMLKPHTDREKIGQAVEACLKAWQEDYPGLSMDEEGDEFLINIPATLRTTHEEHFCKVRDAYLANLDSGGFPPETFANILSRYTLLAEAREKALASSFEMLK